MWFTSRKKLMTREMMLIAWLSVWKYFTFFPVASLNLISFWRISRLEWCSQNSENIYFTLHLRKTIRKSFANNSWSKTTSDPKNVDQERKVSQEDMKTIHFLLHLLGQPVSWRTCITIQVLLTHILSLSDCLYDFSSTREESSSLKSLNKHPFLLFYTNAKCLFEFGSLFVEQKAWEELKRIRSQFSSKTGKLQSIYYSYVTEKVKAEMLSRFVEMHPERYSCVREWLLKDIHILCFVREWQPQLLKTHCTLFRSDNHDKWCLSTMISVVGREDL